MTCDGKALPSTAFTPSATVILPLHSHSPCIWPCPRYVFQQYFSLPFSFPPYPYRISADYQGTSNRLLTLACIHPETKETERLVADPAPGITAAPHEDNLRYFDVTIQGPDGSPFASAFVCSVIGRQSLDMSMQTVFSSWSFFFPRNTQWRLPRSVS